jgi:hypothetical protein
LKQIGELVSYIQDFDILRNKAEISEKQTLVVFLGVFEEEIKNAIKMFESKTLKHAYNLSRLQANTLAYRKSSRYFSKLSNPINNHSNPAKSTLPQNTIKNLLTPKTSLLKPNPTNWSTNLTQNNKNHIKLVRSIKNQQFKEERLKGLFFVR